LYWLQQEALPHTRHNYTYYYTSHYKLFLSLLNYKTAAKLQQEADRMNVLNIPISFHCRAIVSILLIYIVL